MSRVEELEAELEVVRLEAELVAAKDTADGPTTELKQQVRAARQAYRELRETGGAAPGVIATETEVQ